MKPRFPFRVVVERRTNMSSSDRKAALAFTLYTVSQFTVPILLFRNTSTIFDAVWVAGTIAPTVAGVAVAVWFLVGRQRCRPWRASSSASMHLVTLLIIWLGLVSLAVLNLWIRDEISASC
jgi:hypothetical protein